MKKILLILLLNTSAWAACPLFTYGENHKLDAEINNVCDNILNPTINYETVTKAVFNNLSVSTITSASSATITNATITNLRGTTTNDSASSGSVGEYFNCGAQNTTVAVSGAFQDLCSITTTSGGDFDATGVASAFSNGSTNVSNYAIAISVNSGNNSTGLVDGDTEMVYAHSSGAALAAFNELPMAIPGARFSVAAATTIYFKILSTVPAGAPKFSGRMSVRRVR